MGKRKPPGNYDILTTNDTRGLSESPQAPAPAPANIIRITLTVQEPPTATFVKIWETNNKANQIFNPTPKDDPRDNTYSVNGASRNKLFVVSDPVDKKVKITLSLGVAEGLTNKFWVAVYSENGSTKLDNTEKQLSSDGTCNLEFVPQGALSGTTYKIKVGYDANSNNT